MDFGLNNAAYRSKYKAKGIPFRGKMGIDVSDCKTAQEAIEKSRLNYTVAKCPLAAKMEALRNGGTREGALMPNIVNGFEFVEVPNEFATYRTDTNIPLGKVKSRYEVVQNMDAFNFFNEAIGDNIKWDRAGYLGYGQKIFLTASIKDTIKIGNIKDEIEHYFIFTNSHDGGSAVQAMIAPYRIVCMNALHAAKTAAEMYISFKHNKGVNTKILTIPEILGLTKKRIEQEEWMFEELSGVTMRDREVQKYIAQVFLTGEEMERVDDLQLYDGLYKRSNPAFEAAEISMQKLNTLCDTWEYYNEGIGQAKLQGTAYGAYNAVTGYFSNVKSYKNEEVRLKNNVFEGDYITGLKALNYALEQTWL